MRRSVLIAGLAAAVAVAALALGACGSGTVDGMTAADVMAKSSDAMRAVKSASFDGSVTITVSGDKDKVSDPTSAFLLGAPLSLTMTGVVSEDPAAMSVTVKAPLLAMMSPGADSVEERVVGGHVYLFLRGQWYGVEQAVTGTTAASTEPKASTEQALEALKKMGVELDAWVKDRRDLSVEQVGGMEVYRLSEEVDVDALASGVARLLSNAGSLQQLMSGGEQTATQQQLDLLKAQSGRIGDSVRKYLKGATIDLWIEKGSFYVDRMRFEADVELPQESAAKGLSRVAVSVSYSLSRFNEPVQVEKPAHVKPLTGVSPTMWSSGATGGLIPTQAGGQ